MVRSSITPVINADDRYTPVAEAAIYLSLDRGGHSKIEKSITKSDEKGKYSINVRELPAASDQDGNYYLVVEKPGYERFSGPILIGHFAMYLQNTILFKKLDSGQLDKAVVE